MACARCSRCRWSTSSRRTAAPSTGRPSSARSPEVRRPALCGPLLVWYGRCVYNMPVAKVKERWDFRVDPDTDRLVRQAAETAERTLTDFVVDAAVGEAERLLADRREFVLDAEQ